MEIDVEELYVDSCLENSMFYDFGDFDKAHRGGYGFRERGKNRGRGTGVAYDEPRLGASRNLHSKG